MIGKPQISFSYLSHLEGSSNVNRFVDNCNTKVVKSQFRISELVSEYFESRHFFSKSGICKQLQNSYDLLSTKSCKAFESSRILLINPYWSSVTFLLFLPQRKRLLQFCCKLSEF